MKIGYPCINLSLPCRSNRTFRLKNYSENKLIETIAGNLDCLLNILLFNIQNEIFFFRITSDLIPFASHPIMKFNWQDHFNKKFAEIGQFIKSSQMRISMHPGQYTVLNSPRKEVYENSLKDLDYHVDVLDLMILDKTAKVQVHVGGVYGDKKKSKQRFIERYINLSDKIKNRLIIENDDKSYSVKDCLEIHQNSGIPVVFDAYHHECLNSGEPLDDVFKKVSRTWSKEDGLPIVHYSSEHPTKGKPSHAESININHFKVFLNKTRDFDFDLMLEIKDKEKSLLTVKDLILKDLRYKK